MLPFEGDSPTCAQSPQSLPLSLAPGETSLAPNCLGISELAPVPCKICRCMSWAGQVAAWSLQGGSFEPMSWTSHLTGVWQEMFPYVDH